LPFWQVQPGSEVFRLHRSVILPPNIIDVDFPNSRLVCNKSLRPPDSAPGVNSDIVYWSSPIYVKSRPSWKQICGCENSATRLAGAWLTAVAHLPLGPLLYPAPQPPLSQSVPPSSTSTAGLSFHSGAAASMTSLHGV